MKSSKEKSLPVVVFGRDEFIAGLVNTDLRNPLRHTKAIENGQIMRQKGFTDMEPGVLRLVDQHHAPSALGKKILRRRPCRAAADYGNIIVIVAVISDLIPSIVSGNTHQEGGRHISGTRLRPTALPMVIFTFIYRRILGATNTARQANIMVDFGNKIGKIKDHKQANQNTQMQGILSDRNRK